MSKRVFIIAEAGVNHNGDINLAKQLIDAAKMANADAVKFQTFKPGEVTGKFAFKVSYQQVNGNKDESRYEMSRKLALSYDAFRELQHYANQQGILFLSTPDGYESLNFLVDELNIPIIKIGSTEVTHVQFLEAVALKKKPVIFSTGLSTLEEVTRAVSILKLHGAASITVLQCTSEYPAPYQDVNLRAMVTMHQSLNLPVGLSDHSIGMEASIAAVALGAVVIEKHFTLDKNLEGPDHQASLTPQGLAEFIVSLRRTEEILGDGIKRPMPSEAKNLTGVRRSIVAAIPLTKGTVLTKQHLTFKRPNTGIEPIDLDKVIGKTLLRNLEDDEVLHWEDVR